MDSFIIDGGRKLNGSITVSAAKNAVLPIISASLLCDGKVILTDCPKITDVEIMLKILEKTGSKITRQGGAVVIDNSVVNSFTLDSGLTREIRASIFFLGSLLARFGKAELTYPGGCAIGLRPIDLHIDSLEKLGASVIGQGDIIICSANEGLKGNVIDLRFPSVGATENIIMAAVKACGETTINNAAREPEIVDLANFLIKGGAKIYGAGTEQIKITGVKRIKGITHNPISDRIEAGTFILGTLMNGGEIELKNADSKNFLSLIHKVRDSACKIGTFNDKIYIKSCERPKAIGKVVTKPYPGFPTDLQAPLCAMLCVADGESRIEERVFECRFRYLPELQKLGADVYLDRNTAYIRGVERLTGNEITAYDLRGCAGLLLAGLNAKGQTRINSAHHIFRGYENLESKLKNLNQQVKRITDLTV